MYVTPDVFDQRGQLAIPDLIQLPEESIGKTAVFSCSSEILSASYRVFRRARCKDKLAVCIILFRTLLGDVFATFSVT